jgi:dTDP-4-dehydrorhamnose 3,5-epimerase
VIGNYALEGITVKSINLLPDERGAFAEVMRSDWTDLIDESIVQVNMSFSYPGIVRAWHRHLRGQVDYFLVLKGDLKICAYDDKTKKLVEIVNSSKKPEIIRMPGWYWHGYKNVSNETSILIYFTNRLYEPKDPDEIRRPWNDSAIIPAEINGGKNDPRLNKPFDWLYPPFK